MTIRRFRLGKSTLGILLGAFASMMPEISWAAEHSKTSKIKLLAVYSMAKQGARQGTVEISLIDATTAWDNGAAPGCATGLAWYSKNEAHLHSAILAIWSLKGQVTLTIDDNPASIIGGACQVVSAHAAN